MTSSSAYGAFPAEGLIRLQLLLAYDGTDFSGWARQPGLRTVQAEVEAVLATVLRLDVEQVATVCAGRTDAGVHARGQTVHVDIPPGALEQVRTRATEPVPDLVQLVRRVNAVLPPDIALKQAQEAPAGFHARFGAVSRRYTYRISDQPATRDPLLTRSMLIRQSPLDVVAMNEGLSDLVGEHDFAAFCKYRPEATTVRTLLGARWERTETGLVEGMFLADAFCHSMVRSIVGACLRIGEGGKPPGWLHELRHQKSRSSHIQVVPPQGLVLEQVNYPPEALLAQQVQLTQRRRA